MDKFIQYIKIFLYVTVVFLICTYILGRFLDCSWLLSFTDFESNGGVWFMFILLISGVHLPELRLLVKEVIKEKIHAISGEMLYQEMKNRTINDSDYLDELYEKLYNPDPVPIIKEKGKENFF